MALRIALNGSSGRMGRCITQLCNNQPHSLQIVLAYTTQNPFQAHHLQAPNHHDAFDILIDCSTPPATHQIATAAIGHCQPLLICTTGLESMTLDLLRTVSQTAAVMIAPNTSLGIVALTNLAQAALSILGNQSCDIDIIESHHRSKKDIPSGTALMLRQKLAVTLENISCPTTVVPIHSVRAGTVLGAHTITFNLADETLTLQHTVHTRDVFARGAIEYAQWLIGQGPGLYEPLDALRKS